MADPLLWIAFLSLACGAFSIGLRAFRVMDVDDCPWNLKKMKKRVDKG